MTARILLCRRMGAPCLLLDLRALRRVSATEWLVVDDGGQRGISLQGGGRGKEEYRRREREGKLTYSV